MRRPEPPQPEKPVAEMTPDELAAFRTKLRREIRDRAVVAGTKRPRTMREMDLWRQAQAERDQRQARRIARAERADSRVVSEPDVAPPD